MDDRHCVKTTEIGECSRNHAVMRAGDGAWPTPVARAACHDVALSGFALPQRATEGMAA
ncbi:hypothetical protein H4S14_003427 [Agrobacterium vitis]|nr:hypothetical protein [Agrobacterium vitis]MBE1439662.1 hypothetical protein [Agrobacterium vitis]